MSSSSLWAHGPGDPSASFAVGLSFADGSAVLAVRGELDRLSAPELDCVLSAVIDRGHRDVVLELSGLAFMDAAGLRVVSDCSRRMGPMHGSLTLRSPPDLVRRMLDITALKAAVHIEQAHQRIDYLGPEQARSQLSGSSRAAASGAATSGSPASGADVGVDTLVRQLRQVVAIPAHDDVIDGVLRLVVALAQVTISGADGVSVSLNRRGKLSTVAASNQTIADMDSSQYATGEGPCVDASVEGRWFHVESLAEESRWPAFIPKAAELGIKAILSNPLMASERPVGALNIYSRTEGVFSTKDEHVAALFASEASGILAEAGTGVADEEMVVRLADALVGRHVIAQAQGVMMEREQVSEDEAYTSMRRFSQRTGMPLLDRAADVVASTQRGRAPKAGSGVSGAGRD